MRTKRRPPAGRRVSLHQEAQIAAHPVYRAMHQRPAPAAGTVHQRAGELLALADFERGTAGQRSAQDVLDMMLVSSALARQGIGAEVLPMLDQLAVVLKRVHAGPHPMRLAGDELQLLRDVQALFDQQRGMASEAEFVTANLAAIGRLRGFIVGAEAKG